MITIDKGNRNKTNGKNEISAPTTLYANTLIGVMVEGAFCKLIYAINIQYTKR